MVVIHIFIGLASAFVLAGAAFGLGSLFLVLADSNTDVKPLEREPIDALVATALGLATIMLVAFCLLAVHAFYPIAIIGSLAIVAILTFMRSLKRSSFRSVLAQLFLSLCSAAKPAWLAALGIAVVLSAPAILPPDSYDSTMYHFPYAIDWSSSHYLKLDPYLRFPLAQFNIELLYAIFFAFNLEDYVQFVTWMFFALAATGIASFSCDFLKRQGATAAYAGIAGFLTSCLFMVSPIVLRCADVGLVDIPAGVMLLAFGIALVKVTDGSRFYLIPMAAIGGSFIGIKLAFAPSFVLFALIILFVGRLQAVSRKRLVIAFAVLSIFTAPWFVRNLVVAGDPIDPMINLALHRSDPFWNQTDLDAQKGDLSRKIPFYSDPVWLYLNPNDAQGAASINFCFFYIPFIVVGYALASGRFRKANQSLVLLSVILAFEITLQLAVSNRLTRYTLQFYPLFLVLLTTTTWSVSNWISERTFGRQTFPMQIGVLIVIALYALPPPVPIIEYNNVLAEFQLLSLGVDNPKAQLSKTFGYTEANDLATLMAQAHTKAKALTINFEYLAYFFREKGIVSLGDWWGQARLRELVAAVDSGTVPQYVDRFEIGGVLIRTQTDSLGADEEAALISAFQKDGFAEVTRPESEVREFIRRDILAQALKNGASPRHPLLANAVDFEQNYQYGQIGLDPLHHFVPGDRSANIFQVVDGEETVNSITIISGNRICFDHLAVTKNSILSFDVAKIWNIGTAAVAWVDVRSPLGTKRIFSQVLPPETGEQPSWQHVSIRIGSTMSPTSLTFGASSIASGGIGDWVAFVRPILSDSRFISKKVNPATLRLAKTDVETPREEHRNDVLDFVGSLLRRIGVFKSGVISLL